MVFSLDAQQLTLLILSAVPVFLVGLAEDLGYDMSPKARLVASAVSSLVAIFLLRVWLSKLGVPGFDAFLTFSPFGILFTIFAKVGVVNAFNLIDDASMAYRAMLRFPLHSHYQLSLFIQAIQKFQSFLSYSLRQSWVFMVLNFPMGKIFLGDGGAYALGHLLVWSAIILINSVDDISPFAILLVFFWQWRTQAWLFGAAGS